MTKGEPPKIDGSRVVRLEKIPDRIQQELDAKRAAEVTRRGKYGEIKPIIHADHRGTRFVAVGSRLYGSKNWKTFSDFLISYPRIVLGKDWFRNEAKSLESDWHPIVEWAVGMERFQQQQVPGPDGLYGCIPNGFMDAFVHLAYDLYVTGHNTDLQSKLITRLKNKDQFQGARYELFATASCIKAGFEINYEDETDLTKKHPEFIAYHRSTNQRFAVEAKSKHWPGVLSRPGQRPSDFEIRMDVSRLLERAYEKSPDIPYIIFIDLNMPRVEGEMVESDRFKKLIESVPGRKAATLANPDPFNMILVTNHPSNYAADEKIVHTIEYFGVVSTIASNPLTNERPLKELAHAVDKYGNLPNFFSDE